MMLRAWRDPAFRIMALALSVAALSLSAVLLLRAELDSRFQQRTAEVLGGELVLEGSRAPETEQLGMLGNYQTARRLNFASVLVDAEQVLLISAKAVSNNWPLFGEVLISDSRFAESRSVSHGPEPGEAWVGDQVLDRLNKKVGDQITLGVLQLPITAVVKQEPDQGAGFYSMNPRVLINSADLEATGVIGPGTRYRDHVLLAQLPSDNIIEQLNDSLRPDQEIEDLTNTAGSTLGPLRQLTLWLALAVLLVTLLCGAAIYLTSGLRMAQKAKQVALLRTFGASRNQVYRTLITQEVGALLPVLVIATAIGIGLFQLVRVLTGWNDDPMAATPSDWFSIILIPLLLLIGYLLPRLHSLTTTPAMSVLRANQQAPNQPLALVAALLAPLLLAALITGSLAELAWLLLLLVLLTVCLPLLLWPLLVALEQASHRITLVPRLALRRLTRRPMQTLPLLASLLLAASLISLSMITGQSLLTQWRQQLPEQAPNFFVLNLFTQDKATLAQWQDDNNARAEPLYPIVRGRLTQINDIPVREAVTKESDRAERALNRDLTLTESAILPDSNTLESGAWFSAGAGEVSAEKELAQSLQLELGDTLSFVTSRGIVKAELTSIREVDWESFSPNFYFMFSDGTLAEQDVTWLTSFYLPNSTIGEAGITQGQQVAQLMQQLPHITLLDVNALLDKAQIIIAQASQASLALAIVLIIAALLVLLAALLASQQERKLDQRLLWTLGSSHRLIRKIDRFEFFILSLLSAGGALLITLSALWPLGDALFNGNTPYSMWILLPLPIGLIIFLSGLFASQNPGQHDGNLSTAG